MTQKIEIDIECPYCKGTGLYSGMGEDKDCAVVCHYCRGTGCYHYKYSYNIFKGRKDKKGIKWVYETNPGIRVGEGDGYRFDDFGGMSYRDWKASGKFPEKSENRKFVCPAWWYQSVDDDKKPDWNECIVCGTFSSCKHFKNKHLCWERWDTEYS